MDIEKQVGRPNARSCTFFGGRRPSLVVAKGHRCPVALKVRAGGASWRGPHAKGAQSNVTEILETLNETRPAAPSPIVAYLESLLDRHADDSSGEVATYIPELASADPDLFGICLVTVDGAVYEAGETRQQFTIQSMSKPLTYGLALALAGPDAVRRRVGVEPSGDPFNEISLRPATGTPVNPMINAGAITCAGLVLDHAENPLETLLRTYSDYAGRRLTCDDAVYRSEAETGHRTARSPISFVASTYSRATPRKRSTCTSVSARSRSTAATSRSSQRRSPAAASTRAPASARCARASSAACSAS
jgi:hypothetical protein